MLPDPKFGENPKFWEYWKIVPKMSQNSGSVNTSKVKQKLGHWPREHITFIKIWDPELLLVNLYLFCMALFIDSAVWHIIDTISVSFWLWKTLYYCTLATTLVRQAHLDIVRPSVRIYYYYFHLLQISDIVISTNENA